MLTARAGVRADQVQSLVLDLNGTLHGNNTAVAISPAHCLAAAGHQKMHDDAPRRQFAISGRLSELGRVTGSFGPDTATDVPLGSLPNLGNATLELANHSGSVLLNLAAASANLYQFRVAGGSGKYATADGAGTLTLTFRECSNEYLLVLRSARN